MAAATDHLDEGVVAVRLHGHDPDPRRIVDVVLRLHGGAHAFPSDGRHWRTERLLRGSKGRDLDRDIPARALTCRLSVQPFWDATRAPSATATGRRRPHTKRAAARAGRSRL